MDGRPRRRHILFNSQRVAQPLRRGQLLEIALRGRDLAAFLFHNDAGLVRPIGQRGDADRADGMHLPQVELAGKAFRFVRSAFNRVVAGPVSQRVGPHAHKRDVELDRRGGEQEGGLELHQRGSGADGLSKAWIPSL